MSSQKPVILFIHGSWHTPEHMEVVRDVFHKAGYDTSCPAMATIGKLPPIGFKEDVDVVRSELLRLVDELGQDVVVVAHSYGGVVATEAVDAKFAVLKRQKEGKTGGVLHVIYMCSFLLEIGASLGSALGGELPPFIEVKENGMCMMLEPERRFFNDLPDAEQRRWTEKLQPCPAQAQLTPITGAAYLHHPVTYVFCENDQALLPQYQHMMVDRIERSTAGVSIRRETCSAGHSPYLSQPAKILEIVGRLLRQ